MNVVRYIKEEQQQCTAWWFITSITLNQQFALYWKTNNLWSHDFNSSLRALSNLNFQIYCNSKKAWKIYSLGSN